MIESDTDTCLPPLRGILRAAPTLSPEDSVQRLLLLLRHQSVQSLPISQDGYLVGVAYLADLLVLLGESLQHRAEVLVKPVVEVMRASHPVGRPDMSVTQIGALCTVNEITEIPIADETGWLFGYVTLGDMLLPSGPPPRPARVGGMATPFGVYLTDGNLRAGAGSLALISTGFSMAILMGLSYAIMHSALMLMHRFSWITGVQDIDGLSFTNGASPMQNLESIGLFLMTILVFFLLMRMTPLAGYHAAEHQTVHAMERSEPLIPEIVSRMPRPHPRCGTNLMAAGITFMTLTVVIIQSLPLDLYNGAMISALLTLFTWRNVGTFIQEKFTTKPATPRQIASGIRAGNELTEKYLTSSPKRPRLVSRIWSSGMPQVVLGGWIFWTILWGIESVLSWTSSR